MSSANTENSIDFVVGSEDGELMMEREREKICKTVKPVQRLSADQSAQQKEIAPEMDPASVERVARRAGDDSCAAAHAST